MVSWRHHERTRPGPAAAQGHGRGLGLTELSCRLSLRCAEAQPLKPRCPSGRRCRRQSAPLGSGGLGPGEGAEHRARRRRWDGREELGRREAGRGGMRRGKKAWVVEVERRTRGVTEPPDGPAPRQELTTAFVTKFGPETLKSSFSRRGRKSRMA